MNIKFKVSGMTCSACSARVENVVSRVHGVVKAEVNLLAGTMVVCADNEDVIERIITAVRDAGYMAELAQQKEVKQQTVSDNGLKEMKVRIIGPQSA